MEHDACAELYPDCAAVVGWALCGATIGIARKISTLRDAVGRYFPAGPGPAGNW
jgi:hypothetical protein